jgi:hypothetical protein
MEHDFVALCDWGMEGLDTHEPVRRSQRLEACALSQEDGPAMLPGCPRGYLGPQVASTVGSSMWM